MEACEKSYAQNQDGTNQWTNHGYELQHAADHTQDRAVLHTGRGENDGICQDRQARENHLGANIVRGHGMDILQDNFGEGACLRPEPQHSKSNFHHLGCIVEEWDGKYWNKEYPKRLSEDCPG